jgi:ATP-dependent protease HslVU (ClpYQ) peptidase subunit
MRGDGFRGATRKGRKVTCIAGLVEKGGRIVIGADSQATAGYNRFVECFPKVFLLGEMLVACAGSRRVNQLLKCGLQVPFHKPEVPVESYLVNDFMGSFRSLLGSNSWRWDDNGQSKIPDGSELLLGYRGRLFGVWHDFQIGEVKEGYLALGSGGQVARGALYANGHLVDGVRRIMNALEAAQNFDAGVGGPFLVLTLDPPKGRKAKREN